MASQHSPGSAPPANEKTSLRVLIADDHEMVRIAMRYGLSGLADANWFGLPTFTAPSFSLNFSLLVLPAVAAHTVASLQRFTGNRLLLNVVTGGNSTEHQGSFSGSRAS